MTIKFRQFFFTIFRLKKSFLKGNLWFKMASVESERNSLFPEGKIWKSTPKRYKEKGKMRREEKDWKKIKWTGIFPSENKLIRSFFKMRKEKQKRLLGGTFYFFDGLELIWSAKGKVVKVRKIKRFDTRSKNAFKAFARSITASHLVLSLCFWRGFQPFPPKIFG